MTPTQGSQPEHEPEPEIEPPMRIVVKRLPPFTSSLHHMCDVVLEAVEMSMPCAMSMPEAQIG
jgi:hypothetical protein